jgi:hypothetical protein
VKKTSRRRELNNGLACREKRKEPQAPQQSESINPHNGVASRVKQVQGLKMAVKHLDLIMGRPRLFDRSGVGSQELRSTDDIVFPSISSLVACGLARFLRG